MTARIRFAEVQPDCEARSARRRQLARSCTAAFEPPVKVGDGPFARISGIAANGSCRLPEWRQRKVSTPPSRPRATCGWRRIGRRRAENTPAARRYRAQSVAPRSAARRRQRARRGWRRCRRASGGYLSFSSAPSAHASALWVLAERPHQRPGHEAGLRRQPEIAGGSLFVQCVEQIDGPAFGDGLRRPLRRFQLGRESVGGNRSRPEPEQREVLQLRGVVPTKFAPS